MHGAKLEGKLFSDLLHFTANSHGTPTQSQLSTIVAAGTLITSEERHFKLYSIWYLRIRFDNSTARDQAVRLSANRA